MHPSSKPLVHDRSPIRPSRSPAGTIGDAIDPPLYTPEQHETWRQLCQRQLQAWQGRVLEELHLPQLMLFAQTRSIPSLASLSQRVQTLSGWQIVRAEGLVPFPEFTRYLAQRLFPCSDAIRNLFEVDYTNEPDMFHDLMGHLPSLAHPFFASLNQILGAAAQHAQTPEQSLALEKIYWYCLEFGLVNPSAYAGRQRDPHLMRAFGAGLLAAPQELSETFSGQVPIQPFRMEAVIAAPIDVYQPNSCLFEVDSLMTLSREIARWLQENLYTEKAT